MYAVFHQNYWQDFLTIPAQTELLLWTARWRGVIQFFSRAIISAWFLISSRTAAYIRNHIITCIHVHTQVHVHVHVHVWRECVIQTETHKIQTEVHLHMYMYMYIHVHVHVGLLYMYIMYMYMYMYVVNSKDVTLMLWFNPETMQVRSECC